MCKSVHVFDAIKCCILKSYFYVKLGSKKRSIHYHKKTCYKIYVVIHTIFQLLVINILLSIVVEPFLKSVNKPSILSFNMQCIVLFEMTTTSASLRAFNRRSFYTVYSLIFQLWCERLNLSNIAVFL